MHTIDFETKAIVPGDPLLPEPVGVAIEYPTGEAKYWAWGHPEGNNCTKKEAQHELARIWEDSILTHNGATFDVPVGIHHLGLPTKKPEDVHDTLFEAYLHNPHAESLSLKPLADDWLNMPPEEQYELQDWIMGNVPACRSRKQTGMYISEAPGELVGKYAIGDVRRTTALHVHLANIRETMEAPYLRERRLAPILVGIQNKGVRCNVDKLNQDYRKAVKKLAQLDDMVRCRLCAPGLCLDSPKEVVGALRSNGFSDFTKTAKGADSSCKESLEVALAGDPDLLSMLNSRGTYATLVTTMKSWLEIAERNGGRIHAAYNQVRNPDEYGTRTGRLSSSHPNFQNVSNDLGLDYFGEPFPLMKSYLLPEAGHVWTCGDFKAQEPRLTAHFEDGALLAAFIANPTMDPYQFIMQVVGGGLERKPAKEIFLGLIYAMGAQKLADKLGVDYNTAAYLKSVVRGALPDVNSLERACKRRFSTGMPIRTLGGRIYFCEPPSNGRTWEYKALNTLIQGSAADQTKEAMIYTNDHLIVVDNAMRLLGSVHDEFSVSHPEIYTGLVYDTMQEAANALPCDCPMIMDIKTGENWAEAAK